MMMNLSSKRMASAAMFAAAVSFSTACSEKEIDISNPNVALAGAVASDPTALQLLATGLFTDQRATRAGMIQNPGYFGREMYNFTPNEGRNVTNPLIGIVVGGRQVLDPAGFSNGAYVGEYNLLRDAYNFKNAVNASVSLSAAQKSAAIGLSETFEGLMLLELLQTRDSLGVVIDINADLLTLSPFVSRDSGYKYVLGILDDAAAKLGAGGTAFPFTVAPGFGTAVAGVDMTTPAGFLKFNRAIKARAAVYYAPLGGGTAAWNAALTALTGSFLNAGATTRAAFDVGAYDTYAAAPDTPNPLTQATNTSLYAHPSFTTDVQKKADGTTPDDRYTAKIRTGLPSRQGPVTGDGPTTGSSTIGFSIWPTQSSPIPIIRNEELILLRAEARLGTGDKAGAIADINQVRVNSGGLPASTLTTASTDAQVLDGILYEKRYSLMAEGVRWSDLRRYGRLGTLPLDVATGPNKNFVAIVMPIPQAECLNRLTLAAQFLGPNGQNNCK